MKFLLNSKKTQDTVEGSSFNMELLIDRIREVIRVEQSEVLNPDQAAAFLNISKPYLYRLTSAGEIPFSKPHGKMIYFSRKDLVDYALSNRRAGSIDFEARAATIMAKMKKR
jgi:excisionase family DNA binding protein